jgi:hypothetical protein
MQPKPLPYSVAGEPKQAGGETHRRRRGLAARRHHRKGEPPGQVHRAEGREEDRAREETAAFDSVAGGVALLPDGGLAVAVWGGVHPLYVVRDKKTEVLFTSSFGFQNVVYSERHKGLIAAEQCGKLWLLDGKGTPKALLDEDAGTSACRLHLHGDEVPVARTNRVVQRVAVRKGG